jgi:hypothetical protein
MPLIRHFVIVCGTLMTCLDHTQNDEFDSSDNESDGDEALLSIGEKLNISAPENEIIYLLGHPEDFLQKRTIHQLMMWKFSKFVRHIIIDEAHCTVQWGENFRPKYRQLGELRSIFNDASIVAVTATATVETQKEIAKVLRLVPNYKTVCTNTDRNNIKYIVHRRPSFVGSGGVDNSYHTCIVPFVDELRMLGRSFPKTVIFTGLKWCGFGHQLARCTLGDNQELLGSVNQYHAHLPSSVS